MVKKKFVCKESLQFGHSAFYKSKAKANVCAKVNRAKIKKTKHTILGKGWLVFK